MIKPKNQGISGSEKKADDLFETQILFDLVQLSKMLKTTSTTYTAAVNQ